MGNSNQHQPGKSSGAATCSPFASVDDFIAFLHAKNANAVDADNGMEELFGKKSPFRITCIKCGSMDVSLTGDRGFMGTPDTGYCEGSNVIKCNGCGAAVTSYA